MNSDIDWVKLADDEVALIHDKSVLVRWPNGDITTAHFWGRSDPLVRTDLHGIELHIRSAALLFNRAQIQTLKKAAEEE